MEADDLIYAIVSEHHDDEEIMIVSSDKDFQQLQAKKLMHILQVLKIFLCNRYKVF